MKLVLTKKEYINKLAVQAMYYWFIGDKFNARNALAVAVHLVKELEDVSQETRLVSVQEERDGKREDAKILALDFPTKRAAAKTG